MRLQDTRLSVSFDGVMSAGVDVKSVHEYAASVSCPVPHDVLSWNIIRHWDWRISDAERYFVYTYGDETEFVVIDAAAPLRVRARCSFALRQAADNYMLSLSKMDYPATQESPMMWMHCWVVTSKIDLFDLLAAGFNVANYAPERKKPVRLVGLSTGTSREELLMAWLKLLVLDTQRQGLAVDVPKFGCAKVSQVFRNAVSPRML